MRRGKKASVDRSVVVPAGDVSDYLAKRGRREARANIPGLPGEAWSTPAIVELEAELQSGIRRIGEELFLEIAPLDIAVAAAMADVLKTDDLLQAAAERAEAADAESDHESDIRLRRRVRDLQAQVDSREAASASARSRLALVFAERADVIERHRERVWAYVDFMRSCNAILLHENYTRRRRSVPKGPENMIELVPKLPDWVLSDGFFASRDAAALRYYLEARGA